MAVDSTRSLKELFLAALATAPAERPAWLADACGDDAELRLRLEQMLAAHENPQSLLDMGARPAVTAIDDVAGPDRVIGGMYKLLEKIGEGGMGVVFMAEQIQPVRRKVALKILKPGMDTRQVIARFEQERQALALMDHPNIAKVLDAGVSPPVEAGGLGRPYFVMELVKGVPITMYCDDYRLTPNQRLELFVPVCQAVQHAHHKGIIHRDIKPSNVLVALYDDKPVIKVIDFGVAKATGQQLTDQTLHTGFGAVVGTVEYMSPEQAGFNQLDVDIRCDIYSLGVLLYELLAGSPPFTRKELEKAGMLEMLRVIREQEPSKPSTKLSTAEGLPTLAANRGTEPAKLTKLMRGELDWIVMKALEKDRSRRYETANGFAIDVQRYLADEPVQACPPSTMYRLRKFLQRNKAAVAVAALVLFFLVLLGSGVGWMVRDRAVRQAKVAGQVELIVADVDRLEREQKWPEALEAARRAEAAVTNFEADAATAQRVRALLKDIEFIDRLEQIRMRGAVVDGKTDYAGFGRESARAFRDYGVDVEVLAVEASIDRMRARPALAIPVAAALDNWIQARRRVSAGDAAGWKRLVAVARGIDPEPLRDWLRSTWGRPVSESTDELLQRAESIDIRKQQPATLVRLALALRYANHSDFALRILRDGQYVYPTDTWLTLELGAALAREKDHEGAIRYYTAAVAIRPKSASAHTHLGCGLAEQKKLNEAIVCFRRAIELDPKYANAHSNLGSALSAQKNLDEAVACLRTAIELDPNDANTYSSFGSTLHAQRKLPDAITAFDKAIEIDPKFATAYYNLGVVLSDQNKLDEAIVACRKAIELDPRLANAYSTLGIALSKQKKMDEAIAAFRKAIDLNPSLGNVHYNLALALRGQKKLDEAIAAYRKFIDLNPKDARGYTGLGNALRDQEKLDEAIAAFEEGIRLLPKDAGAHNNLAWLLATCEPKFRNPARAVELASKAAQFDPTKGSYLNTLGVAHYRAENWKAAIESLDKSTELRQGGDSHDWFFLAMAHWQLGEKESARKWYAKAVEWTDKNQPSNEELRRNQAEAAKLIGIESQED